MITPTTIAMLSVHTCPVAALGGKKTGGMNVYVRELSRELGARGMKVDIFTRCESRESAEVVRLGPNVQVIHVPSGPDRTLLPSEIYPYLPEFINNVLNYRKQHYKSYDLIHAHYWLSGIVGLELKTAWRVPLLVTFHTLAKVKEQFLGNKEPAQRHRGERRLVGSVDLVLAFTPDEKRHLVTLYGAEARRIRVIPPGIDLKRFRPISPLDARKRIGVGSRQQPILFVGRLDPIKRVEVLLQALTGVSSPGLCLIVVGGEEQDQDLERIKSLAQKLGISQFTSFLGSRDQRVLPYYYSASRMTIIPSSYESFGLVALESLACGTPVVASKVGGLRHLIEDGRTGFLIPPENVGALARTISRLLLQPKLRDRMGDAARLSANSYAWHRIIPHILDLYAGLPTKTRGE